MRAARSPVVAAGLIAFALALNLSAGNVILPAVERDLGTTLALSRWVVLGYALACLAFVPFAGWVRERLGRRRALRAGVAGFAAVSVACSLAPEIVTLLAARVLLGAFAAVLTVLAATLAISGAGRRVGGLAVAAVCATLGGFTGAAAGGGLVSPLGWRVLLLLPVGLCLLALAARIPDEVPALPAAAPVARVPAVLAVTLLATLDALVVVLCPFFLFQGQVQQAALPLVGLTVLGLPLALVAGAAAGSRLARRAGARAVTLAGVALAAAGLALLLPLSAAWSAPEVALRLAVAGAGMGLYGGPAHSLIMTGAAPDRAARHLQFARGLGYLLGPALGSALWASTGFARTGMGTALLAGLGALAVAMLVLIPFRSMTTRRPSLQRPGAAWTPTRSKV